MCSVSEHAQKTLIYSTEENEQIDLTKRIQLIHQFGDDGTIVWLNKHGELLSLSQSLQDESGEAKFISAERREIVAFDAKFPKSNTRCRCPNQS